MSLETSVNYHAPLNDRIKQYIASMPFPGPDDSYTSSFRPHLTMEAVISAGIQLRYAPYKPLADDMVQPTMSSVNTVADQTLSTMINASISRPEIGDLLDFTCVDPEGLDNCGLAESYFIGSMEAKLSDKVPEIITSDGKPILMIKNMGERTCLTLCEIAIDGIPYPAGSIARPLLRRHSKIAGRSRSFREYDVSDVTSLGFLRLSQFALPRDQRSPWHHRDNAPRRHIEASSAESIAIEVTRALHRRRSKNRFLLT